MSLRIALPVLFATGLMAAPALQAAPASAEATIPAVALSHDGEHLAWIVAHGNQTRLMLGSWTGKNAHAVSIPGPCAATGLRWAPRWNTLAVLTQCPAEPASDQPIHGAIWLLDVHAGTAAHRIAAVAGYASGMQWQNNSKTIAFLYAPGAASVPSPGHRVAEVVAAVPAKGGSVQIVTPSNLDVHAFRLARVGNAIAFTATSSQGTVAGQTPALYVQAGPKSKVVFDPAAATGALHGLAIRLPRWANMNMISFLGRSPGASADNLYSVPASGGKPVNRTEGLKAKPAWFTVNHHQLIVTSVVDGRVKLVRYGGNFYGLRETREWFSLPGSIGDGRAPSGVSISYKPGYWRRVAFVQTVPGKVPVVRSGLLSTQPPPVVATAGSDTEAAAH